MSLRPGNLDVVMLTAGSRLYHPRHYHLFAVALERAGLRVAVLGQPDPTSLGAEGSIPVYTLPPRRGRVARMLSGPLTVRQALRMRPALLQVNSLELLPWAALARRLTGIPMVYDSNEDYASAMLLREYLPEVLRRPLAWLTGLVEPICARSLDKMFTADRSTADLHARHIDREQIMVLHNFPWRSLGADVATGPFLYDATFHGTLPGYLIDEIMATAHVLDRRGVAVRWCIAAREYGPDEQASLDSRLRREGLRDRFTLLYNLPFPEIAGLVRDTYLGFIPLPDVPKFRHNIPRKLFEFLSVGRPAVASDLPATAEVLGGADCTILARAGDPESYADGIETLLQDPDRAASMGATGRGLILDTMNAEHELAPYVELCRELVSRARSA